MEIRKRPLLWISIFFIAVSIVLRSQFVEFKNGDLLQIRGWYDFLLQNGYKGLADGNFSVYPPSYLYLLYFATLLSTWVEPFTALKLIPTVFDLISTFTIYKLACIKYSDDKPYLLAALFFLLPTVMLNSTGWGQVDSLYGSFLLVCFYLLLTKRPFWAFVAFGIGFSFKAQSIFLLPFLGILFLRKEIRWYYFLIVPAVYLLIALPAIFIGRSWESALFLYAGQANLYQNLARYAPNLYFLIPIEFFHPVFEIGMGIFLVSMLAWAWVNWRTKPPITQNQLLLTALASTALAPFLLPKMLDRYFYPADLFSFVTAMFIPQLWFVPLFFQLSSGMAYTIFMFGAQPLMALPGALINTALVIIITREQLKALKTPQGDIHATPRQ